MQRRHFLRGAGAALVSLSAGAAVAEELRALPAGAPSAQPLPFAAPPPLAPIRASAERIIAINVCTRPFRAQGPRIEAERIGRKTVIHNYGHGGAGWSLSWGAATHALRLAQATGETRLAVIGCGAIGLTTAVVAQRAGLRVRIYAKERLPNVPSFYATGTWSPGSRIVTSEHSTPEFEKRWEDMARISFRTYQTLLGLPGLPVEWGEGYVLIDPPEAPKLASLEAGEPEYPHLESRLIRDLNPRSQPVPPGQHPFAFAEVRRYTRMTFNLSAYSRLLMDEFLLGGGEIETREFGNPREFTTLREKTVINATGYGARALLGDQSLTPVRGQTARLIPQPEVNYNVAYPNRNLNVVSRRDGILVQAQAAGDFGNADTTVDRAASEAAVATLASVFAKR